MHKMRRFPQPSAFSTVKARLPTVCSYELRRRTLVLRAVNMSEMRRILPLQDESKFFVYLPYRLLSNVLGTFCTAAANVGQIILVPC